MCIHIGYDLVFLKDEELNVNGKHISWAEIKKPGQLNTVKLNQASGEIKSK